MYLKNNYAIIKYFLLKLTKVIFFCWFILISVISLIDIIDLNNKTRLKENILFNDILLLTIENIPLRADELLFYAILFGSVIYFLELRKTNELLILRINGISLWKTFIIVSIVPLMLGFISIFILNPIISFSQKIYSVHHENIFGKGSYSITISNQGLWLRDRSNLGEIIIKGVYLDSTNATIKKPVFFLINSDTKLTKRIDADWAYLENQNWHLKNVKADGESFNTSKKLIIKSVLTKDDLKYTSNNQYSLNIFEIPKFIKILDSTGIPSIEYKVYFHKIFSQPVAFIGIIVLTGSLIFRKHSRLPPTKTISFTIIGSFLYFFLQRLLIALGTSEQMPIIVATWIPSIILLGLGLLVISLVEEN
mgnify:FL=1|tara:strand:- start:1357 stop:2451 length:1095 start_codon:yes stop_codon:yes gene_type:complete